MPPLAILLLAAGSSSRMAPRDKLLEHVNGEPLIALLTRRANLTGLPCYVTLPHQSHPRAKWIGEAIPIQVPDASEGMAASIRAGVSALPDHIEAVMILPTDMPEIDCQDLMHMAAQYQNSDGPILRASTADGMPGHPVLFPRRYFEALLALKGDSGARSILVNEPVQLIALPGLHATTDLDTLEAWVKWRADHN
ncbi:nucleotidyltransferase family protein [Sedimentitalea sp. CY04]|uniref:Nucleotidyltransferase family protein n=1 Tax=Parasedimentitalea denitrificans TaxID=2211118 RepID=A0ABX0WBI3_9RHOB|nr:nucleotidyltransferase family protein [Sedimentitalea sp. CY04]NIZ63014.1 nucleotidyltransferase family protein [Sedimentitalea sp. CY04]